MQDDLLAALADTPAVFLAGPRQAGKSTLARHIGDTHRPARYLTLDDAATRKAASDDPTGFVAQLGGALVIDEVQRVPDLFLAIKQSIDRDRQPGRFLLTGSANILTAPKIADALAGRMQILPLFPLSQGEIEGVKEDFVGKLFDGAVPQISGAPVGRGAYSARVLAGGYPDAITRTAETRRQGWFQSYVEAILLRDVRDLSRIEGLDELPRLQRVVATRACNLVNFTDMGRDLALPKTSVTRYFTLLEMIFLVRRVPPWLPNLGQRLIKTPKTYLVDSGLMAHLLDVDRERLTSDGSIAGILFENFAGMELHKQLTWSKQIGVKLYHYRTAGDVEVDIVLESRAGDVVGLEVKSGATADPSDFNGLRGLRERLGGRFRAGVLLYTGEHTLPFGERLYAVPLMALWST